MNRKTKLIVFVLMIASAVLIAACSQTQPKTNQDSGKSYPVYELKLGGGFIMPSYANQVLVVQKGKATWTVISADGSLTDYIEKNITDEQYAAVQKAFSDANFMSLNDTYTSDVPVADVGFAEFSMTQDGVRKTVKLNPNVPSEYSEQIQKISEVLSSISDYLHGYNSDKIELQFRPMQCQETPWEKWYSEGNIKFIKEPTEAELVTAYYSQVYGIELTGVNKMQTDEIVCEACDVCPKGYTIVAQVDSGMETRLKEDGWKR